jgi:hypothetical protein
MPFTLKPGGATDVVLVFHSSSQQQTKWVAETQCSLENAEQNSGPPAKNLLFSAAEKHAVAVKPRLAESCPRRLTVFYRLSDSATPQAASKKDYKPPYITDRLCLFNCLAKLCGVGQDYTPGAWANIHILADNVNDTTYAWLEDVVARTKQLLAGSDTQCGEQRIELSRSTYGSGAGSFNRVLDLALELPDDELAYFLEDDFLHKEGSPVAIREAIEEADIVSLYDHPDNHFKGCMSISDAKKSGYQNLHDATPSKVHQTQYITHSTRAMRRHRRSCTSRPLPKKVNKNNRHFFLLIYKKCRLVFC